MAKTTKRVIIALGLSLALCALMALSMQASAPRQDALSPGQLQPTAVLAGQTAQAGTALTNSWPSLNQRAHIEPALLKALLAVPSGTRVPVIVTMRAQNRLAPSQAQIRPDRAAFVRSLQDLAQADQANVHAFLDQEAAASRVAGVRPFWIFDGLALDASIQTAISLAARSDVALLQLDNYRQWLPESRVSDSTWLSGTESTRLGSNGPQAIEWGVRQVRADQVWTAFNITGTGVVVANLDTGVDFQHPALNANYRGNAGKPFYEHPGNWFDATDGGAVYPSDGNGHGTHTMGTLAGRGGIGVAPGARWIAARVLNSSGSGYDSWIHAGFQWLLAPNGDASLAPDIVSNSWGNADSAATTFGPDIARLQQAGIVVVFSAGNNGPDAGSLGSPASLPGVFAVGATDDQDHIANFSGRGPSPWGGIKPQIAAPGVGIRSSLPGGGYALADGTSMAAPHVAGVAALLRAANPGLGVTATQFAITNTAWPLGQVVPNNDSGWGRVDAYRAVQAVTGAGTLSGVVVDATGHLPLPGAQVAAFNFTTGITFTVEADAGGRYESGLTAGRYRVSASSFGYLPDSAPAVTVITGQTTLRDFAPVPLPIGIVRGALTDAASGRPVSITVAALSTPVKQNAYGAYELTLPAGDYVIEARGLGYRVVTATVSIQAGHIASQSFGLIAAPRTLLVNSGAWYGRDYTAYYQMALDGLRYSYDRWQIRTLPDDTPTISDLLKYDLVIWSSPQDSPGYLGADGPLQQYLNSGRKLILSGQDVAFWDGGGANYLAPYLRNTLSTLYVKDDAGSRSLSGVPGGIMAGLKLTIAGGDGANNQTAPDEIGVSNPDYASKVFSYDSGGSGANQIGLCLPYRAVFMGFGYEAISSAARRQDVMQSSVDFLSGPRQADGFGLNVTSPELQVAAPGSTVTFTVRVRNTAETGTPSLFKATLVGPAWSARLTPGRFTLHPCSSTTLTISVTIPAGLPRNVRANLTLTVQPVTGTVPAQSVKLLAKTPSAMLLVAHDRFYNLEDSYTSLLDQLGISYDVWTLPRTSPPFDGPSTQRLSWYPLVLWYTGYDWYRPMTPSDEAHLSTYLDSSGRLLLSSPFYMDGRSSSDFARNRLGVLSYADAMTASLAYGSPGYPLGAGIAATALISPFPGAAFSVLDGALVPSRLSSTAWRADHNRAVAIASDRPGNRLVFWDIPLEALPTAARKNALQRTLGWLGPLGDSTANFRPPAPRPGQPVTLTIEVHNNLTATTAAMTATLPDTFVPNPLTPLSGLVYDPTGKTFGWSGLLPTGATRAFTLTGTAQATPPTSWTGKVVFHDQMLGLDYDQPLRLAPGGPDLSSSSFGIARAEPPWPPTLAMVIRNTGAAVASSAVVTSLLPFGYPVMTNSLQLVGPGAARLSSGGVTWQGPLRSGETATVTYQLKLRLDSWAVGRPLEMLAGDGQGGAWEWRTWPELIPGRAFLPLVSK